MLDHFHTAVSGWFNERFDAPTEVQCQAWRTVAKGENTLIAAPTGSGKTLAAFLAAIDQLVKQATLEPLSDAVSILYVSPLKALSNDIERNLQDPLEGIEKRLQESGAMPSGIRVAVRTGDTTPGARQKMRRKPPQILVTTPESLYLLLTSQSGRAMLASTGTVIIDEIHALASNKRGAHLSLSLQRLETLCPRPPVRIGLSATQRPIERVAEFLCGTNKPCSIVDTGHKRDWDIQLELPGSPLSPVMANEVWSEQYARLEELITEHRTTLIFVNTRRLAERLAKHLAERLGEDKVTAHHGSLAKEHRLQAEQRLKSGELSALVATASLELGIDIGHVDLVCQMGSPRSIAAFLQRIGRAGHSVGQVSKGRIFPLSRDELVECVALIDAVSRGELDNLYIPEQPLDVLSQQLVAELSAAEWTVDSLYDCVRSAYPYRNLSLDDFTALLEMLANGYSTRRGRRASYIYFDAINQRLRGRRNARLTALMNGGAIPDQFDYDVIMQPASVFIGSLNEDFAFESLPGDIFQLGNTSYRILKVEQGRVFVEDAHGQPPNIPFWFGEAPGRSDELSLSVSRLRADVDTALDKHDSSVVARQWSERLSQPLEVCLQMVEYLAAARAALDGIPTQENIMLERFFDEAGDMHLVLHAPFGSRLNRAWGLSLRKRFCRRFNFELQAAALEDCLILSLGETHSFSLDEVMGYLDPASVRQVLIQALLDAPMFAARWRWNATIALAIQRMRNGRKVPPQLQRSSAEDLIAVVFPDQLACLENIRGERAIPDHPLVRQTIDDCLTDTMDIEGLESVLSDLKTGNIKVSCHDLNGPSPLAAEIINARPFAFLDGAPAEERRTLAIRPATEDLRTAARLASISPDAVAQVQQEAWIQPRDPDELHDSLLQLGFLTLQEALTGTATAGSPADASRWGAFFQHLQREQRATLLKVDGCSYWVAAERLAELQAVYPEAIINPVIEAWGEQPESFEQALVAILRSRFAGQGPMTTRQVQQDFSLQESRLDIALITLEQEGYLLKTTLGRDGTRDYWCERRLLARIHRYSREQKRRSVQPVAPQAYMQFLCRWHSLDEQQAGDQALYPVLASLEGWAAPLAAWDFGLLPARVQDIDNSGLDQVFLNGLWAWFRPGKSRGSDESQASRVVSSSPLVFYQRGRGREWGATRPGDTPLLLGAEARQLYACLESSGATFASELMQQAGLLETRFEAAIAELIAAGLVNSDSLSAPRYLLRREQEKHRMRKRAGRFRPASAPLIGRWSLLPEFREASLEERDGRVSHICNVLLRRYGVVFRAVLEREPLLPPWRTLLRWLRRMEDRGEVLGGRFVSEFSGEQFALSEAAVLLRQSPDGVDTGLIQVHACDPLNLSGIITPGVRVPARDGNCLLFHNGLVVAWKIGDKVKTSGKHVSPAEAGHLLNNVKHLAAAGALGSKSVV